jgi:hypothetical protein
MYRLRIGALSIFPVPKGMKFTPSPEWATLETETPNGKLVQFIRPDGAIVGEMEIR